MFGKGSARALLHGRSIRVFDFWELLEGGMRKSLLSPVGYQENFLHGKGCEALARLPRAVVESLSLEGLKRWLDVAFGDMI